MANRSVVALYEDFTTGNEVVRELVNSGFSRDEISILSNDSRAEHHGSMSNTDMEMTGDDTATGASVGAGLGAVIGGLGGLLVGLGALTIPGIGPVIAAGPLAAALSGLAGAGMGAVAGGVTGGLLGALVDLGVPEEQAHYYAEGVRRGGTLVTVRTDDFMSERAMEIMNRFSPIDINERGMQWREAGWQRFDPDSEPYMQGTAEAHDRQHLTYMDTDYNEEFGRYDEMFRQHYQGNLTMSGYPYDYYIPAYRYGYTLADDDRFRDRDWSMVEMDARREWEMERPGTWEEFKDSIRHAWDRVRNAVD